MKLRGQWTLFRIRKTDYYILVLRSIWLNSKFIRAFLKQLVECYYFRGIIIIFYNGGLSRFSKIQIFYNLYLL